MAMLTYCRISDRLETPIASNDTSTSTTEKQERIEPVKAVNVSQPLATAETKSSLPMVSDQVDWSQVAACVENKTNCVCYGHKAQRLNIVPESCQAAVKFGWLTTKQL